MYKQPQSFSDFMYNRKVRKQTKQYDDCHDYSQYIRIVLKYSVCSPREKCFIKHERDLFRVIFFNDTVDGRTICKLRVAGGPAGVL